MALPAGLLLKVSDAVQNRPLAVLLENGAPSEFLQRKVGDKSQRFLHVMESDPTTPSGDAGAAAASAGRPFAAYRQRLAAARITLRADAVLGRELLVVDDPLCWPPPHVFRSIVLMRSAMLSSSGQIEAARKLKEAFLVHMAEVDGTGIFPLSQETVGDNAPVAYAASVSGEDSVTLKPTHTLRSVFTVDYSKPILSVVDLARGGIGPTARAAVKAKFGIEWSQMVELHLALWDREVRSGLFHSPMDLSSCVHCASGAMYSLATFRNFEREAMSNDALMRLIAANANNRVRLRHGVYATKVSIARLWTIHVNHSVGASSSTVPTGSLLTEEEVNTFHKKFHVRSLPDELLEGNVKVFEHGSPDDTAGKTTPTPEDGDVSPLPFWGDPQLILSKQVQLSARAVATEFKAQSGKAVAPDGATRFVPGEHFVIIHGPRVAEQYVGYDVLQRQIEVEFEQSASDETSRKRILQSLREIGEIAAEERKQRTIVISDGSVEDRLIAVFAKHDGRMMLADISRDDAIRGIPVPQLRRVLRKIGHYDKRNHRWIKL